MKKLITFCLVFAAGSCFAQQPPANPLTGAERGVYMFLTHNVVAGAEKMPEENYSFRPTADVRTFGQLVGHLADANNMFCGMVLGEPPATASIEKTKTAKADLVQALKDAIAHCGKAFDATTDANGVETVKFMGRDFPKLTVLSVNTAHNYEHYGNMVTYMRIKGIVPPSSEQAAPAPPKLATPNAH
ncbi:MAG TPA: DinB family protein [Bryobacteraceae bacterium]|nr:DinB family protein [Bryobacteraceae bacterium]